MARAGLSILTGAILGVTGIGFASAAQAGLCDYRPSQLMTSQNAGRAAQVAVGAAAMTAGNPEGIYTLIDASSGGTMVGNTWRGVSAAGTIGLLSSSGTMAAITSAVSAPFAIVALAGTAVVVGGVEAGCFFSDKRITDYDMINALVADIGKTAPSDDYTYYPGLPDEKDAAIRIRIAPDDAPEPRFKNFRVKNMYISKGVLMHKDWGPNTTLGVIGQIHAETEAEAMGAPVNEVFIGPQQAE